MSKIIQDLNFKLYRNTSSQVAVYKNDLHDEDDVQLVQFGTVVYDSFSQQIGRIVNRSASNFVRMEILKFDYKTMDWVYDKTMEDVSADELSLSTLQGNNWAKLNGEKFLYEINGELRYTELDTNWEYNQAEFQGTTIMTNNLITCESAVQMSANECVGFSIHTNDIDCIKSSESFPLVDKLLLPTDKLKLLKTFCTIYDDITNRMSLILSYEGVSIKYVWMVEVTDNVIGEKTIYLKDVHETFIDFKI